MRASLTAHVGAALPSLVDHLDAPRRADVHDVPPAMVMASEMASSSASAGRDQMKSRAEVPLGEPSRDGSSACTSKIESSSAIRFMPSRRVFSSHPGNSSMPLGHMKALKPITPRFDKASSSARLSGTSPPQRPKSTSDEL